MAGKEDVLKQLLEELLSSADENGPIGHCSSRDDLDINKQVIELVVNAGLMVLTQRQVTGMFVINTLISDELLAQATRSLAAIRATVRKGPEVLLMQTRETIFADWLFPRMCFLLCYVKDDRMRGEIISALADVLRMWKEGHPSSWGELRKCTEKIKSNVSGSLCPTRLTLAIIQDLGKEESSKSATTGNFVILLPSKDTFEIRITDPWLAFLMTTSLIHLLSLVLEPRNTQWLVANFLYLDELLEKWQWCEAVHTATTIIRMANLDAARACLREATRREVRWAEGFLNVLVRLTRLSIRDDHFSELLPSVELVLETILELANRNSAFKSVVGMSSLQETLRNITQPEIASFSLRLRGSVTQIIQMCHNPPVTSLREKTSSEDTRVKRRHIETSPTIDAVFKSVLDSINIANNPHQESLTQLNSIVADNWTSLTDPQRVKVVQGIGVLCCAAVGKLKSHTKDISSLPTYKCSICDGAEKCTPSKEQLRIDFGALVLNILRKKAARVVNIAAIRTFGRLVMHDSTLNVISLSKSPLADTVLNLLNSEYRDQRIAVAQTLPLLLKDRDSESLTDVLEENRRLLFRHLHKIQSSSSREKPLLETTVMAYSEIGKVAAQRELNLVLLSLVDFLGHNNSFIAALAYRETLAVATEHGQSTWQMFSPFWPDISIKVIEQMKSRPQILQRLAEILEIRDSVFLVRTQNFTVPFLVSGRHRDVLEQMSLKMAVRMWEMLKTNMPFILARLFTQDKRPTETGIEFLVSLMAANKTGAGKPIIDKRSLIFSSRTPLTIELLKMLASESDAKREMVFYALQTVAIYASEKPIHDVKGTKAQEYLKLYLQNNILELMNHFTDIITDKRGRKTFTEKIGCIAGIQEIIRFAAAASKAALPQVSPCKWS
jgi:UME (NUC010) domain